MTENEELELLKQNSPYALPDDPSSSGWSTDQIKEKFYTGLIVLYDFFKQSRTLQNTNIASMQEVVAQINREYIDITQNNTLKVKYDSDNNEIVSTYAKLVDIANGTVSALKFLKTNGTSKYIYEVENDLAALTNNFNLLKEWADNIKSASSEEAVQRAVSATKDSLGQIIKDTYATVTALQANTTNISNIISGTTVVGKAYKDQNGNVIDTTYATKIEDGLKVAIADIVDNLTTTATNKPLSANQGKLLKDAIDNINALLQSNDTDLDQLQEIVTYIKSNKTLIDGITTSKVNVSDIIDDLVSQIANKPLSANQGYVLKGFIDTIHTTLLPSADNTYDLGSGSYRYKDVYVNGNLKDGTNSVSVSDLVGALADIVTLQSASHTHSNKALLDTYTQTETDLADAVSKKHSHSNKSVLDNVTQTHLDNSHTHSNKSVLDGIASTDVTNWNDKYSRTEVDAKVNNAVAIANGKTKSYVIDLTDNASFNAVTDTITLADSTTLTLVDGSTVTLGDLKAGDVILITDTDVPDRWVAQITSENQTVAYRMDSLETRKVDITPKEDKSNKVTALSSGSTDTQYPSAKCVYDGLATKQDVIDSSHKIASDNVDDSNSTNKFVTASEKTTWNAKSNFSGNYNDLSNKPTIPTVPTNVSAFTNDAGYLTSHQDIKTINGNSILGTGDITISANVHLYRHHIIVEHGSGPAAWHFIALIANDNTVVNTWAKFRQFVKDHCISGGYTNNWYSARGIHHNTRETDFYLANMCDSGWESFAVDGDEFLQGVNTKDGEMNQSNQYIGISTKFECMQIGFNDRDWSGDGNDMPTIYSSSKIYVEGYPKFCEYEEFIDSQPAVRDTVVTIF